MANRCPHCGWGMVVRRRGPVAGVRTEYWRCLKCQASRERERRGAAALARGGRPRFGPRPGSRADVVEASEHYVRKLLSRGSRVPKEAWPRETVALKRGWLLVRRQMAEGRWQMANGK